MVNSCQQCAYLRYRMITLTTLQNNGFFMNPSCGGRKRGRRWPAEYFETGRRGRSPSSATPQQIVVPTAQIRSVHRKPTLSNRVVRIKGKTNPKAPQEDLIRPNETKSKRHHTADTPSRKNDATCKTSPLREPFWNELNDRNVEKPPANSEEYTL